MTPNVAVINESTVLTDQEVERVLPSIQVQLSRDAAPLWGQEMRLWFFTASHQPPDDYWQMGIFDNADQAGALGYHDVTATGQPLGKVFAGTDIQYGASWSVTLSHETLEMAVDPGCILSAMYQDNSGNTLISTVEVADVCEDDSYGYDIDGVKVSDFCLPSYWGLSPDTRYSFKGNVVKPFDPGNPQDSILPGGYLALWTPNSGWSQVVGQQSTEPTETTNTPNANTPPNTPYNLNPPLGSRRERRMRGRGKWIKSLSFEEITTRRNDLRQSKTSE